MAQLCSIEVPADARLEDLLFERGVEFPCGGASLCGGCRVRVIQGEIPVTPDMQIVLTPDEIAAGWRLACQARARGRVTLEIAQWEGAILADESRVPFEARDGLGIAVDLGTTTLAAELLDFATGDVLAVRTALNPQCAHGADVMSRIQFALREPETLTQSIRQAIGTLVDDVAAGREIREVLLCGNTVMHHLFCGQDVEPLSRVPFETPAGGAREFASGELGWKLGDRCVVRFLPILGSFVGSDILAGMVAVDWLDREELTALIDLGTNGEIVIGNRHAALCASAAAGPAFEAGRIRMGMRAAPGAISRVLPQDGSFACHVLGGREPRGICGSGLVDAAASALQLGRVLPSGRLASETNELSLMPPVAITQSDIRELQLAKAAIAAGVRILLERSGAALHQLGRVYLAGAFGNYVNAASAHRIGLLPLEPEKIEPAGNTALRGTKILLMGPSRRLELVARIRGLTEHVSLASEPHFQDVFVECMAF
ncbi:MAG TPA: ASKHA domain-containing protein [Bryobacteraceae bacterium]|nr:ASKHA domain-containing protein [Bryobacteraceae bacterium]